MKLENFAGQIFIQTFAALASERRIRADRIDKVKIDHHRRVQLCGKQHVLECSKDVRLDRLFHIGPHQAARRRRQRADGKMIGPELRQTAEKRAWRDHGRSEMGMLIGKIKTVQPAPEFALRRHPLVPRNGRQLLSPRMLFDNSLSRPRSRPGGGTLQRRQGIVTGSGSGNSISEPHCPIGLK